MKRTIAALFAIALMMPVLSHAKMFGVSAGEPFPELVLTGPVSEQGMEYLGVRGQEAPLRLGDIEAEAVLIEIFSMYCPVCQRHAPEINELYELIKGSELHPRLKMIGIGAGNSAFEVDVFRKKYDVPFPLFDDADYTVHKAVGEVGTPWFVLVELGQKEHVTLFSHLGPFKDIHAFLDEIRGAMPVARK
jgi:peroxiredoxin